MILYLALIYHDSVQNTELKMIFYNLLQSLTLSAQVVIQCPLQTHGCLTKNICFDLFYYFSLGIKF